MPLQHNSDARDETRAGLPADRATDKYFGEFYDQRVMTLHPASRFGAVIFNQTLIRERWKTEWNLSS